MSADAGSVPAPYILDSSVLIEIARADYEVMTLIQHLDARGQPLVIPVLTMTAAALDLRSSDTDALLQGLERLENGMVAPVQDAEQASRLAVVIAKTDLDPWDAHVAAIADAAVCPILTLNAAKWRPHLHELDEPLHLIEIADPDESQVRRPGVGDG